MISPESSGRVCLQTCACGRTSRSIGTGSLGQRRRATTTSKPTFCSSRAQNWDIVALKMTQANLSSPELPDYNVLAQTGQVWRDLQGYCTRYGDVRELLGKIDDQIAITNAGDELRLKFAAQPPPPPGWKRDYIMIGDGWIKDGDYNSTFSKTVLPLPYHGMKDYTVPPTSLEQDPAFRLHRTDWQTYHTRYIIPLFSYRTLEALMYHTARGSY